MRPGDTFLISLERTKSIPHLWVVVTAPNEKGELVIVSITTLRHDGDQTVILQRGDHPFIRHQSTVFFGDAMIVEVERLHQWIEAGIAQPQPTCTAELAKLIQDGIFASDYTPNKIIDFCRTSR